MRRTQTSSTARGTAAMRAIESEKPADARICCDPFARKLTDAFSYFMIKLFAPFGERITHGALTFIVCRCRFFDDCLKDSLKSGVSQVVILGAGLDSRAYREEMLKGTAKVFEVDHPATQADKMERVKKIFGKIPSNVTYVPVDFNEETLDKLSASGFNRSVKSLFLWEGVTYYLNAEAVDATLAWVRANAAPGSSIIFDIQYPSAPARTQIRRNFLYAVISRLSGESRALEFEKGRIGEYLARRGYAHVAEVGAGELEQLYCTGPNRNRKVAENFAIVHAEIRK